MTSARRTIIPVTAAPPVVGKNIASQQSAASVTRDKNFLYNFNGEIWLSTGYQPSVYYATSLAFDYDLNLLQQGRIDKGLDRTYGNGGMVEVGGRYFIAFQTLAATREHGVVEVDSNLDIVGSNWVLWDDSGSNQDLADLAVASDGTYLYTMGTNNSSNAITVAKFDLDLTLVDSDNLPYGTFIGCCADPSGNVYFAHNSPVNSNLRVYKYDTSFNPAGYWDCATYSFLVSGRGTVQPVWANNFVYCMVIARGSASIENLTVFKIADDFSTHDVVACQASSATENVEVISQIALRPNGNILAASTHRDSGQARPTVFEFDSDLNIQNQFWISNFNARVTGVAAVSNDSAYMSFASDNTIDVWRFDDMDYPSATMPSCSTLEVVNTSFTFEKLTNQSPALGTPSPSASSFNETVGTLTDGADVFTQTQNCEFTPA